MKYEKPKMEIVTLMGIDVITGSIMTSDPIGGSGGDDDDDTIDF